MIELDGHWISYEWGVQFEVDVETDTGIHEETETRVCSERIAHRAVVYGMPKTGKNHRVVRRVVADWKEVK
ncbi:hypothetical protein SEA_GODONK_54 [Gordonia phage GodonK]|uniref:Uncharacterized protein n=1 Tax=Gordonia phage GodonK TaxID=2562192 RepID=A0A4D6E1Y2_9CAUD|nr:hypothetical protein HOV33_gp054 [Gordonia phage GodonK]QBZ72673.1 hypothetical protein SEA_GODONK_54 [Gordonia phage GodonK]